MSHQSLFGTHHYSSRDQALAPSPGTGHTAEMRWERQTEQEKCRPRPRQAKLCTDLQSIVPLPLLCWHRISTWMNVLRWCKSISSYWDLIEMGLEVLENRMPQASASWSTWASHLFCFSSSFALRKPFTVHLLPENTIWGISGFREKFKKKKKKKKI